MFLAIGRSKALAATAVALGLFSGAIAAQQQEQSKQDIPDAPSASRPFPNVPPTGHGAAGPTSAESASARSGSASAKSSATYQFHP